VIKSKGQKGLGPFAALRAVQKPVAHAGGLFSSGNRQCLGWQFFELELACE
jgi:hypothetical protein